MTWAGVGPSGQILTLNIGGGIGSIDWEPARGDVSGLIDRLIVIGLRGQQVGTAVPIFGDVLFFDGIRWTPAASGSIPHNLLSTTHTDTFPASPIDGDIIAASGSIWVKFPIGLPNQSLTVSSSGDLLWSGLGIIKTEVITSGTINLDENSRRIIINTSGTSTVNLPASPLFGQEIIIKDGAGNAGPPTSNTIDIIPQSGVTIDGLSLVRIAQDFGAFTLLWNNTGWNII